MCQWLLVKLTVPDHPLLAPVEPSRSHSETHVSPAWPSFGDQSKPMRLIVPLPVTMQFKRP